MTTSIDKGEDMKTAAPADKPTLLNEDLNIIDAVHDRRFDAALVLCDHMLANGQRAHPNVIKFLITAIAGEEGKNRRGHPNLADTEFYKRLLIGQEIHQRIQPTHKTFGEPPDGGKGGRATMKRSEIIAVVAEEHAISSETAERALRLFRKTLRDAGIDYPGRRKSLKE